MNVGQIVKEWLEANDYDGLCDCDCGCGLDDLCRCGRFQPDCKPAYKVICEKCKQELYQLNKEQPKECDNC
jgi:hypothetical protein